MSNFYDWKPEYTLPFVSILSVSFGFAAYWFLSISETIKTWFFSRFENEKAWINYVVFQKFTGVVFLGLFPGIIVLSFTGYTLSEFGLSLGNLNESMMYTGLIGSLILFLNYFAAKKPNNLNMYPQMRIGAWSTKTLIINAVSWTAYLLAYEFMYRGILLMSCYWAFGFWPALAVNLCFYSATHIPKGLRETMATIPYGFILCLITVSTGSILVAFSTHLVLALSNDFYSVSHNPNMKFIWSDSKTR
ncbi:MAG TPA: CPBP family intramembrane metalloprotease [Bacteroidia bacterium]|nr:CPBP family intramembrane metalloprotease [Bacteroidia bacterium]